MSTCEVDQAELTHHVLLPAYNVPNHVAGVIVDGQHIQADAVVLALGPWTNTLAGSLQLPHISGQLGHSLVLKPSTSEALPADCLFVSWQNKSGTFMKKLPDVAMSSLGR